MSNAAIRQRRTVPLDDDAGGDQSITEDLSLRSSGHSESKSSHSRSSRSSRRRRHDESSSSSRRRHDESSSHRRRRPDEAPSSRRQDPGRNSFKSNNSGHSRESASTAPSLDTAELKKKYQRKPNKSAPTGSKTPSARSMLTIGNSSVLSSSRSMLNSVASMPLEATPGLPDLFSLERALHECDEEHVETLMQDSPSRQQSAVSTPVAWKTPFEVDRPRETPKVSAPLSSGASVVSEVDPQLSEEQDAWAGIDNLLEDSGSFDDSFVFSMCDILPKDTVKAMRRVQSSAESVMDDGDSVYDESVAGSDLLRSLASMSKKSNSLSRVNNQSSNVGSGENSSNLPQEVAYGAHDGSSGNIQSEHGRAAMAKRDMTGGTLFDVFHWSDKANVDDSRKRTKKLNQTKKVQLAPKNISNHSTESDDMSLPSLASFRPDELNMSRRSMASSVWDSRHHDVSSVVSEDISVDEFGGDRDEPEERSDSEENGTAERVPSLAGDGLILNKQVDDYIRKMQMKLPTIAEDGGSPVKNRRPGLKEETSPSPTSIVDESPFEQLPSLASLAVERVEASSKPAAKSNARKVVEKKEPKQSLSFQFMSSIKKMGKALPTTKKTAVANGDEEKYFPEPSSPTGSKKFSANRSLLGELDD